MWLFFAGIFMLSTSFEPVLPLAIITKSPVFNGSEQIAKAEIIVLHKFKVLNIP
jgi:hypothetical protein